MKQFLLSLLLTAWCAISYSQAYQPIAIDNAHWRVAEDYFTTPMPYDAIYEYYTNGDSTLNALTYKKVYRRSLQSVNNNFSAPYYSGPSYFTGLLRDDTVTRKVYAHSFASGNICSSGGEILLFDFGLNTGDTINLCNYVNTGDTVVDVTYEPLYNAIRRTIWLPIPEQYIEGIGSTMGLFEFVGVSLSGYTTYLENYCVGSDANCDIVTSITNEIDQPEVQFDQVNKIVLFKNSNKYNLRLFNAAGVLVWKEEVCSSLINLPADIPKGLYVLQVYGGGEKFLFKFVN